MYRTLVGYGNHSDSYFSFQFHFNSVQFWQFSSKIDTNIAYVWNYDVILCYITSLRHENTGMAFAFPHGVS